jgi:predicted RNA-binding Zn-ribbon protein involved in translation (DUF1610 family)
MRVRLQAEMEKDMRINCLACGHKVELDEAYDDFEGPIKCLCGKMLMIRTEEGKLKAIQAAESPPRPSSQGKSLARAATP